MSGLTLPVMVFSPGCSTSSLLTATISSKKSDQKKEITSRGVATLTWGLPVSGAAAGFKVYYGRSSKNYTHALDVGMVTTYTITGLAPGRYYFSVTAYDKSGQESEYAKEVSKLVL